MAVFHRCLDISIHYTFVTRNDDLREMERGHNDNHLTLIWATGVCMGLLGDYDDIA